MYGGWEPEVLDLGNLSTAEREQRDEEWLERERRKQRADSDL
jgi:hypothetical protein